MPIRRPTVEAAMPQSDSSESHDHANAAAVLNELLSGAGIEADLPQDALRSIQSAGDSARVSIAPDTPYTLSATQYLRSVGHDSLAVRIDPAIALSPADYMAEQLLSQRAELENRLHKAGEYLAESAILRCRRCRGYPAFSELCRNMSECVARDWAEEATRIIGTRRFKSLHDQSEFMTIPHPNGPEERHFEAPF